MASLDKPSAGTSTVKWRFPDIHPEGRKYVLIAAAIALLSLFVWDFITWPLVFLTLGVAAFFRDPIRVTPQGEGLIVSPADGLVTMIERVPLPPELRGPDALGEAPMVRVSVFMSVFDVHVNRTPITGTIRHVIYISGKFFNADLDKASDENERQYFIVEDQPSDLGEADAHAVLVFDENERQYFIVEDKNGVRIGFTQIAGLVARRIVAFVKPGDMVIGGQRVGLIRFGSRVDVFLPEEYACQVALGQRAIAGETILARRDASPAIGITQ